MQYADVSICYRPSKEGSGRLETFMFSDGNLKTCLWWRELLFSGVAKSARIFFFLSIFILTLNECCRRATIYDLTM